MQVAEQIVADLTTVEKRKIEQIQNSEENNEQNVVAENVEHPSKKRRYANYVIFCT